MSKRLGGRLVGFTAAAFAAFTITTGQAGAASSDSGALQMYEATVTGEQFAELQASGFDVVDPEPTARRRGRGTRALARRARCGREPRDRARALPQRGRAHRPSARPRPGRRRVHRLARLRRHRRHPPVPLRLRRRPPPDREAGRDRDHAAGPRDHRGADHRVEPRPPPGRQAPPRRALPRQARGPLPGHHARARVDLDRGHPAADGVLRRQLADRAQAAPRARALVPAGRQPRRLPVHVRPRAPLAQEPARQRRRRPDHQPRRRRHQPQLPRALALRRRGVEHRDLLRDLPRHRAGLGARDPGEHRASSRRSIRCWRDSYHSYGPLLLYPEGWQVQTPGPRPPGLPGAHRATTRTRRSRAPTPTSRPSSTPPTASSPTGPTTRRTCSPGPRSSSEGCDGCGFVFPDDEALVQHEFEINLPFAIDMARSAADPARPKSHLGNTTEPFYLELVSDDPTLRQQPARRLPLRRLLRRPAAGRGARPQQRCAASRCKLPDQRRAHAHRGTRDAGTAARPSARAMTPTTAIRRGVVTRHRPGRLGRGLVHRQGEEEGEAARARPRAARSGACAATRSPTRRVSESGAGTLVVAAEDYTGISPDQAARRRTTSTSTPRR